MKAGFRVTTKSGRTPVSVIMNDLKDAQAVALERLAMGEWVKLEPVIITEANEATE